MCKVLMIAGIKPAKVQKAWEFAKAMSKPMSSGNRDGLGYSAITNEGKLFGERWFKNDDAFLPKGETIGKLDSQLVDQMGDFVETVSFKKDTGEIVSNSYGDIEYDKTVAITLHTRMATTEKNMTNVHPFVYEGISLIHNGVIRNYKDFELKVSTCDSEAILQSYIKEEVKADPNNFKKVADKLTGYFACGVLTNTEMGPILDVFKSYTASLHATFINELDTFVLSTSDSDIKEICKSLGWTHGTMFTIRSGKFLRMNAITGERLNLVEFDPSRNNYQSSYTHPTTATPTTTQRNTGGNSTGSGTTLPKGQSTDEKPKVYHLSKHRLEQKNAKIKDYYASGKATLVKLNEREVANIMMELDRNRA